MTILHPIDSKLSVIVQVINLNVYTFVLSKEYFEHLRIPDLLLYMWW